jgi:hypothetical protein
MRDISEQWALDSEKISRSEIADRDRMQIEDHVQRRRQYAELLMRDDPEAADAIFDELSGVVGEFRTNEMKSTARQTLARIKIEEAERQYLDDNNADSYIKRLGEIDTGGMLARHSNPIELEVLAKQNNVRGSVNKRMTRTSDYVFDKLANDELESADLAELYNDNPLMGESLDKSLRAKLDEGVAAGDQDAIKAMDALDEMMQGEESWGGAVRRIGGLNSSYGVLALFVANSYAKEVVNTQDTLSAFEFMNRFNDRKLSVDGDTKDYVHTLSYYMKRKGDGHGDFLNKRLSAFKNWQKEPGDKTYAEFRDEQFGEDAMRDVMKISPPQLPDAPDFDNMTIEELEAYLNE